MGSCYDLQRGKVWPVLVVSEQIFNVLTCEFVLLNVLIWYIQCIIYKYELTEGNLLVLFVQEISYPRFEMEERDRSVEQSVEAEAQEEA